MTDRVLGGLNVVFRGDSWLLVVEKSVILWIDADFIVYVVGSGQLTAPSPDHGKMLSSFPLLIKRLERSLRYSRVGTAIPVEGPKRQNHSREAMSCSA